MKLAARLDVGARRRGMALVVVLVVLLVLLVLATPFLLMARNADSASNELADRVDVQLALDTAGRHVRAQLGDTHPAVDRTPFWDELSEIDARNTFDPAFFNANDANGTMWDCAVEDLAARIDLNSCPPQVVANLAGIAKRFDQPLEPDQKKLKLNSGTGLEARGYLWANGELIRYGQLEDSHAVQLVRGVLGPPEKEAWRGGPHEAIAHDPGEPVIDQRAFAPAQWRLASDDGRLRNYAALEELRQAGAFQLASITEAKTETAADLDAALLEPLLRCGSVYSGVGAGAVWQHATRVSTQIIGGRDGKLRVESNRWINCGSTVRITDGVNTEFAIVQAVKFGSGEVVLDKVLVNDYQLNRAELSVLARRPVNVNTASEEVLTALLTNVQIVGRNARVLRDEAQRLAHLIVLARPILGFEDLLKRVLLPVAGVEKLGADAGDVPAELLAAQGMLNQDKLVAIYTNAQNSNDGTLAYSTMPFCFKTRDVYAFELRASVNAPSGVERASRVRDEVAVVAPQRELLRLWARQEDFDESLRLSSDAPGWSSGPNATSRYDYDATPPSRVWANLGTFNGVPYLPGFTDTSGFNDLTTTPTAERVFASRETTAWTQLWPYRRDELGRRAGRVLHFDHETRDPEGRYLPDEVIVRATDDPLVQWTDKAGSGSSGASGSVPLCRPLSFEMWVKPRTLGVERLLDLGGTARETDRISLSLDAQDLILQVLDGAGDHPDTPFKESGEARFALAKGDAPGLPLDVWSHIAIDVRGNRPSQIDLRVNGMAHGVRRPGLTRLTGGLSTSAGAISVESTEGFPERCTVRIGNELVEVTVQNGSMNASHQATGRYAGFGGRTARTRYATTDTTAASTFPSSTDPFPAAFTSISTDHGAGTTVELYGYSAALASRVHTGHAALPSDVGPWRVARVVGVVGTPQPQGLPIEATVLGTPFEVGLGFTRGSPVTGLVLGCPDDINRPVAETMKAFHTDGGYAAVIQFTLSGGGLQPAPGQPPIGGIEIVRYSGWSNDTLMIVERGIGPNVLRALNDDPGGNLVGLGVMDPAASNRERSFVVTFTGLFINNPQAGLTSFNGYRDASVFVVPISLPVPGATQTDYDTDVSQTHVAQITELDAAEKTEWVRYDDFLAGGGASGGHLVRSRPQALIELYEILTNPHPVPPLNPGGPGGPGGGGGPSQPGGGGGPTQPGGMVAPLVAAPAPPVVAPVAQYSPNWEPRLGRTQNLDYPITDAAASVFQFRGVMGTFTQAHVRGVEILPVFAVFENGLSGGRPGAQDAAFLFTQESDHLGWPVRVHRSHLVSPLTKFVTWKQNGPNPPVGNETTSPEVPNYGLPGGTTQPAGTYAQPIEFSSYVWVALEKRAQEPIAPGTVPITNNQGAVYDTREIARLVCYPSGELPRRVSSVAVGGNFDRRPGEVPAAIVDELTFGDSQFSPIQNGTQRRDWRGAMLILEPNPPGTGSITPIGEADLTFFVRKDAIRTSFGDIQDLNLRFLKDLPEDAGLLRIGDEIVCYDSRDPETGQIQICTNGRGLLGTRPQPHDLTEPVRWLEGATVTFLASPIGPGEATLTVASTEDFPAQGTVLIGEELIHYTRLVSGALEMPRGSTTPGAMNAAGEGLFRGRFGTTPVAHSAGEAVILFPFRYWDRWAPRADASELHYFGLTLDQPASFWKGCFFTKEDTDNAQIGVLQRTDADAPWDADPDTDKRLALWWQGDDKGQPLPIGKQSDRIDWRVFVRYSPGAFDAKTGKAHGWKQTPHLRMFGASYVAPSLTLRSVER